MMATCPNCGAEHSGRTSRRSPRVTCGKPECARVYRTWRSMCSATYHRDKWQHDEEWTPQQQAVLQDRMRLFLGLAGLDGDGRPI